MTSCVLTTYIGIVQAWDMDSDVEAVIKNLLIINTVA